MKAVYDAQVNSIVLLKKQGKYADWPRRKTLSLPKRICPDYKQIGLATTRLKR